MLPKILSKLSWALIAAPGLAATITVLPTRLAAQTAIDTLVSVSPGARLDLHDTRGDVTIRTWNRNAVRVVARTSGARPRIEGGAEVLSIHASGRNSGKPVTFTLTVPAAMDLSIHGVHTDVTIEGTQGRVEVHTVQGNVRVQGGRTVIQLHSVQGTVDLTDAHGNIEAQSVNQAVSVTGVSGNVKASTVNGTIRLTGIDSRSVEAETVNGEIRHTGTLAPDGWYRFTTHNGSIHLAVPQGTNATVEVSTFNGEIQASFPLQTTSTRAGKQMRFTLGSGGARIELETFNGTIRLTRPGES